MRVYFRGGILLTNAELASRITIHRYWWGDGPDMPERYEENGILWEGMGFHIVDWNESNLPQEAIELADQNQWRVEDETDIPRTRSGFIRWWLLHHYGGVYSDCDIKPIDPLPLPVLFVSTASRRVCSAFVGCPPRDRLPRTMIERALARTGPSAREIVGQRVLAKVARELGTPRIAPYTCCGGDGSLEHEWTTATLRKRA